MGRVKTTASAGGDAIGSVRAMARRALERLLDRFEYRLTDVLTDPSGLSMACARLKRHGFAPRTVIDVGVGPGTPWLYRAFPEARFELFEAIEGFRPQIEGVTAGLDARLHFCALGESPGTADFEINADTPTSSSMARYAPDYYRVREAARVTRQVPVRTLDGFGPFEGPVLLKLDVEGYEGHVLRGAREMLRGVEVIISEVSVVRRTEAELSLAAYLGLLESLGFSMVNIAEINSLRRGGPIAYMDLVFVRSTSPLRRGAL